MTEEFDKVLNDQLKTTRMVVKEFIKAQQKLRLKLLKATEVTKRAEKAIDLGMAALREAVNTQMESVQVMEGEEEREEKDVKKHWKKSKKRRSIISSSEEDELDFRSVASNEEIKRESPEVNIRTLDKGVPTVKVTRLPEKEIKQWTQGNRYKRAATVSEKRRVVATQMERQAGKFVGLKKSNEEEEKSQKKEEEVENKEEMTQEMEEKTEEKEIGVSQEGPTIIEDVWLPVDNRFEIVKPVVTMIVSEEGQISFVSEQDPSVSEQVQKDNSTEQVPHDTCSNSTEQVPNDTCTKSTEQVQDETSVTLEKDKDNIDPNDIMMNILDPKISAITEEEIAQQLCDILGEEKVQTTVESPGFIPGTANSPVEVRDLWQGLELALMPLDLSIKTGDVEDGKQPQDNKQD